MSLKPNLWMRNNHLFKEDDRWHGFLTGLAVASAATVSWSFPEVPDRTVDADEVDNEILRLRDGLLASNGRTEVLRDRIAELEGREAELDAANAAALPVLAPFMLAGLVLGEWAHHRVDEHTFRHVVFSLLLVAGVFLVV